MFCPQCGVEYREGFTECSDCKIPLVEKLPDPQERPDPSLSVITVVETNDPVLFAAATGLLESASIPYCVSSEEASVRYSLQPFLHPWCRIQVGADREDEARRLLNELSQGVEAPEMT